MKAWNRNMTTFCEEQSPSVWISPVFSEMEREWMLLPSSAWTSRHPKVLLHSLKMELTMVVKIIWTFPAEKCSWVTSRRLPKESFLIADSQIEKIRIFKRFLDVISSDRNVRTVILISPSCWERIGSQVTACLASRGWNL